MNLEPFTGPGSTPSRRRVWDKIREAVIAFQKLAGNQISVDVHDGYGSVISIASQSPGRSGTPHGTAGEVGACCIGDECTITSELECGGVWQGLGTTCDPNPCVLPACCEGAFQAFDGSERYFNTRTVSFIDTENACDCYLSKDDCSGSYTEGYDPDTCEYFFESAGCEGFVTCCFPEIPELCPGGVPGPTSCSDAMFFGCPTFPTSGYSFACDQPNDTLTFDEDDWQCVSDLSAEDCSEQLQTVFQHLSDECALT